MSLNAKEFKSKPNSRIRIVYDSLNQKVIIILHLAVHISEEENVYREGFKYVKHVGNTLVVEKGMALHVHTLYFIINTFGQLFKDQHKIESSLEASNMIEALSIDSYNKYNKDKIIEIN